MAVRLVRGRSAPPPKADIKLICGERAANDPKRSLRFLLRCLISSIFALGLDGQVRHTFPTPVQLVEAGEMELRRLGLGFRAPYVDKTTRLVVEGTLDLPALIEMPYSEAKAKLMECPGIGPKVADCIAVFSLEKLEAFPIDVWVRRALAEWYFAGQNPPADRVMLEWAQGHFGRYGGYAQQYLFHGRRLGE